MSSLDPNKKITYLGRKPKHAISDELSDFLAQSASADAQPGIRELHGNQLSTVFAPSHFEAAPYDGTLPDRHLELEYVMGYNGMITPDNIYENALGKLVYSVAAVCVVVSPPSDAEAPAQRSNSLWAMTWM